MIRFLFLVSLFSVAFAHPFALPVTEDEPCGCPASIPTDERVRLVRAAAYPVNLEQIGVSEGIQNVQAFAIESLYEQDQVRNARSSQSPQIEIQPTFVQDQPRDVRSAQQFYSQLTEMNNGQGSIRGDQLESIPLSEYVNAAVRSARSAENSAIVALKSKSPFTPPQFTPLQTIYVNPAQVDLTKEARSDWFASDKVKGEPQIPPFENPLYEYGVRKTRSIGEGVGKIAPNDDVGSLNPTLRYKTEELFAQWEKSNLCYSNAYKDLLDQQDKWIKEFHDWRIQKNAAFKPEMNVREFLKILDEEAHQFEVEEKKPLPSSELDRDTIKC